MRLGIVPLAAALAGTALPAAATQPETIQRFALVAGANDGGTDRPALQYAVSDAQRFARVLLELGGVAPENVVVLEQPTLGELVAALDQLKDRVEAARRSTHGGRTEVLVYYSGHADEKGLLLGEDRYSYRTLRDRLDGVPADVRIGVLDACASGAITRLKGGQRRQPFLVDESAQMHGHAFLTSSAETESAQESDWIGASYFTHYLISGLRGAADLSGEGKVTLNEAYQFAFSETLGQTLDTKGGAQHPSYDINLSGTGDVVITDLRQTSATLVLGEALDGRFFVRNADKQLVVELYKPYGRTVELALEPGAYEVHVEREATALLAKPKVGAGSRVVLEPEQFSPTKLEATRSRGRFVPPPFAVTGRNRIEVRFGVWTGGGRRTEPAVVSGAEATNLATGMQFTRYLREDLAATLTVDVLPLDAGTVAGSEGVFTGASSVVALPLGLRWNPGSGQLHTRAVKPYLTAGLGPVLGSESGSRVGSNGVFSGARTEATIGGFVGGGADLHLNRRWSLGLYAGVNFMADFSEAIGDRKNFSGLRLGLSLGWMFGRGSTPKE